MDDPLLKLREINAEKQPQRKNEKENYFLITINFRFLMDFHFSPDDLPVFSSYFVDGKSISLYKLINKMAMFSKSLNFSLSKLFSTHSFLYIFFLFIIFSSFFHIKMQPFSFFHFFLDTKKNSYSFYSIFKKLF